MKSVKKIILSALLFTFCISFNSNAQQRNNFQIIRDSLIYNHSYIHDTDGNLLYRKSNILVKEIDNPSTDMYGNTQNKKSVLFYINDEPIGLNDYQEKVLYDFLKKK